jgi:hypothetical protein
VRRYEGAFRGPAMRRLSVCLSTSFLMDKIDSAPTAGHRRRTDDVILNQYWTVVGCDVAISPKSEPLVGSSRPFCFRKMQAIRGHWLDRIFECRRGRGKPMAKCLFSISQDLRLLYFDLPGRGEPIRLAFFVGEYQYRGAFVRAILQAPGAYLRSTWISKLSTL